MAITELIQAYPIYSIIIIAIGITFISSLLTKWLTNQEHMKSLKKRQKEIQKELKECKDDECKMKELQSEMMKIAGTMMKSSFKPVFITIIPFLIFFAWLRSIYTPIMGFGWFWWYLGSSIISSIVFRKLLKMA
tara:strand:- start:673 stop:1074 length:402 start_codon:yes stop_codon:yes gene_type:complete